MTMDDKIQNSVHHDTCEDCLILEALKVAVQEGEVSNVMLHQRLQIGFSRAGRLIDLLEKHGFIGPQKGPKPRKCLLTARENAFQKEMAACGVPVNAPGQDDLLLCAAEMAVEEQRMTVSMLQRKLAIGYARAGRLVDMLVACGVIERGDHGSPYVCRVSREELGNLLCDAGRSN